MALNLDDLIGSMQHGFHAGDRGNDLNEIRENLKVTLGQQALGPSQHPGQQVAQPGRRGQNQRQPWDARIQPGHHHHQQQQQQQQQQHSSLDGDVAMLSGSVDATGPSYQATAWSPNQPSGFLGVNRTEAGQSPPFGGPGSIGSQGSSTSSFGFGGGFAAAPANTPQQTPVETSTLARQLQAELERAREVQGTDSISEGDERSESDWMGQHYRQSDSLSPSAGGDLNAQSDYQLHSGQAAPPNFVPRKLVNGFSPSPSGGFSPPSTNQIANSGR